MLKTAWKFLKYDKAKSIGALAGMFMSVFLIGQQCGIFIFITTAMSTLVKNNPQYIWIVDAQTENANALYPIDQRLQQEIGSIPYVKRTYPLLVASALAHFQNGMNAYTFVVGVDPVHFVGGPWNIYKGKKEDLNQEGAVFTEFFDQILYGGLALNETFEINGKQVINVGFTKGIRGFAGGSYVFTTLERARAIGKIPLYKISALLVEAEEEKQQLVIDYINENFGYIKAWKSEDLAWITVQTILRTSIVVCCSHAFVCALFLHASISSFSLCFWLRSMTIRCQ